MTRRWAAGFATFVGLSIGGGIVGFPPPVAGIEAAIGESGKAGPVASGDAVPLAAEGAGTASDVRNALAGLPSPPGRHIDKLRVLGRNTWLDLGRPAADPKWGRARGRSWTANMAFAPSLEGAFLFGEGVHGWYNAGTGRYMDGLWLYDVMAHRWINVYPGTDVRNPPELIVNRDGFVALPDGRPIPIATMVHGYQMTTWDPVTKRFMAMPNRHGYYKSALPGVAAFIEANRARIRTERASPWFYDMTEGRWGRLKTRRFGPSSGYGDTLIYVPSMNKTFFRRKNRIWFYDAGANRWTPASPLGLEPPFGIDATSCYDPKRGRIYIGGGSYPVAAGPNALWIYDLARNRWIDPRPSGVRIGNSYGTNSAMMHCDLANDVVLLFRHKGSMRGIYAYDPNGNAWSVVATDFPEEWSGRNVANGFYHPGLGIHFFHVAGNSRDNGRIFAYRY